MFKTKKAAGDAVSTLILFIAVVGISVGLVVAIKNYAFQTQESLSFQNEVVNNQLKTSIEITNIYYNSVNDLLYVYVKNIGETKLISRDFDLYVNDAYIVDYNVTSPSNFTVSQDVVNIQDTVAVISENVLSSGSHKVKIVSGYGGSGDTDYFNN
jgi:archaellum component FlaG (FlaF/FlaG flagellin family)